MVSQSHRRVIFRALAGPGVISLLWVMVAHISLGSTSADPQARVARRIERALEAGRTAEASADAEAGVKQYPTDPVLRRRRAQVHICVAIQLHSDLRRVIQDTGFAGVLQHAVNVIRNPAPLTGRSPDSEESQRNRQRWKTAEERLLTPVGMAAIGQFQERARKQLQESGGLLGRYTNSLLDAFRDLDEARRLGDQNVEASLTDLWGQVVLLSWRQEAARINTPDVEAAFSAGPSEGSQGRSKLDLKQHLEDQAKLLAPFAAITPDATLRAAADMAKRHPSDPVALAGAADIIAVVAAMKGAPDPLRTHALELLERSYLRNPSGSGPQAGAAARAAARQLYLQARDAKDADVVAAPTAVAVQLYEQALRHDTGWLLPHLRLRVYLLRLPFERERAEPLLAELRQHQPRNAVVPLEQARIAFLIEDKPADGLAFCREAARLTEFSRSYLVAVPASLRAVLKFHEGVRELVETGWPGYRWLFLTLTQADNAQQKLAAKAEVALLRLKLADLVSRAPDYSDQALGITYKTAVLNELSSLSRLRE